MPTDYKTIQQSFGSNGGIFNFGLTPTAGTTTAATATSGFLSFQVSGESTGSIWPNTIQSIGGSQTHNGSPLLHIQTTNSASRGGGLARIYLAGTLNLTATGNGFTSSAAQFPLLRDEMGQIGVVQSLIPFIKVTTALSGVAASIRLQTQTGTFGYSDQEGNIGIGTKTFTFPSATTAAGSCFFLPLNNDSTSCRYINQIRVDVASTTGACEVYFLEILAPSQTLFAAASIFDALAGSGINLSLKEPARATNGTVTSYLVAMNYSSSAAVASIISIGI